MVEIRYKKSFIKDLKDFERAGKISQIIQDLDNVINLLRNNEPLPQKYKDHQLSGDLKNYRDCHIKGDIVLIYRLEATFLELIAIDKHNNIFKKL